MINSGENKTRVSVRAPTRSLTAVAGDFPAGFRHARELVWVVRAVVGSLRCHDHRRRESLGFGGGCLPQPRRAQGLGELEQHGP
jgi:hypothetical protein